MENIKSYLNESSEEEDPVENECNPTLTTDYLGLSSNSSDEELEKATENYLASLKTSFSLLDNSLLLSQNVSGPQVPDNSVPQHHPTETFCPQISTKREKDLIDEDDAASGQVIIEPQHCPDLLWEEIFQAKIHKDKYCRPPADCNFNKKISEKCISRLQWNLTHSNLLLTTSMDGCIRIWNYTSRSFVSVLPRHQGGIKAGIWSLDGKSIFTGGYDKFSRLTDLVTGQTVSSCPHQHLVSSVCSHPTDQNLFLSGSFNCIYAWDVRCESATPVRIFSSNCKQVLCMVYLPCGEEFVCSSEVVSRDSADRTIMAWHFASGSLLSNQIYQERYICPWLCVNVKHNTFLAQSTGNYIAEFSTVRPYKMNKYRRYEGHSLSGYGIGCCLSPDCCLLASGDSQGGIFIYRVGSANLVQHLTNQSAGPSISLDWHPQIGSLLALGTWNGNLQFWH